MNCPPVALFVYNRVACTRETLKFLNDNEGIENTIVYIFSDGPKNDLDAEVVAEVRAGIRTSDFRFKFKLVESDRNMGLAASVITGVTKVLEMHDSVIVLEDDLLTSRYFFDYMKAAIETYRDDQEVMQVSGHQFPVNKWKAKQESFFLPFCTSWGWATWRRAWSFFDPEAKGYEEIKMNAALRSEFNLNDSYNYSDMLIMQMEKKNIDSWAIRWWWSVFRRKGIVLYPDHSLVKNIGFGKDATHTTNEVEGDETFNSGYRITVFPKEKKVDVTRFRSVAAHLKNRTQSNAVRVSFLHKAIQWLGMKNKL